MDEKNSLLYTPMISKTVGKYGADEGNFKGPRGIAIEPSSQNIYVADSINSRIQVFSKDLTFQFSFPKEDDSVRLNLPWGICIRESLLFITASSISYFERRAEHGIYVYTLEGKFITRSNRRLVGKLDMKLSRPQGIAVDFENNAFIADSDNSRVIAYYVGLPLYKVIVTNDKEPMDVSIYRNKLFILLNDGQVLQMGLHREEGVETVINCKRDTCKAEFFSIFNDMVYVSDRRNSHIIEYSLGTGKILKTIGQPNIFSHIKGLACDQESNILVSVCEHEEKRLKLIHLGLSV